LKVIGAGFGRTGTLSLKTALEKLGFVPCYHMVEVPRHPGHGTFWKEAMRKRARGEPIAWDAVFGNYRATVDFPAATFYAELAEAYPEAKVVLTVRDPQRWYDSAHSAFGNVPTIDPSSARGYLISKAMGLLFPTLWEAMSAMYELREGSGRAFDGSPEDREHATKEFERHIREVKERVPARRLLVYEVKQGWEPLCEFLGVEAPREPFPRLNERGQFPKLMRRAMLSELARSADKLVAVASALVLVLWVLRRALSS
jgi:Sulfotransferase domain